MTSRFSVTIVHRNEPEILLPTLDALAVAIDPAHDEVFVVDNGSSDDSLGRKTYVNLYLQRRTA